MFARTLTAAVTGVILGCAPSHAQEALVTYKTLSPEIALELANAALADCRLGLHRMRTRYFANDGQSEWAARARRSLKFCEMQIHSITASVGSAQH